MSTARRKFTREFKVAAVKRLQAGFPVGRVARELEVNPNQLHNWKRQFEQRPNSAFPGEGRRKQEEPPLPSWSVKLASRRWKSIF